MMPELKKSNLEKQVLESLSTAIILFDRNFRLLYINTAAEMLFAVSSRKAVGSPVLEMSCKG